MNITEVSTSLGGTPESPAREWLVDSPVELAPSLRVYRRNLFLRFPTGGQAHRIQVDIDAAGLRGAFEHYEYNALVSPDSLDEAGKLIFVDLEAPRLVSRINFTGIEAFGSGLKLELYRIDGDTASEKPTVVATVSSGQVSLPASGDAAFTSHRFAIGLRKSDNNLADLGTGHIASVMVRSYPATPRVGLAPVGSDAAPAFFWTSPGEVAKPGMDSALASLDRGTELAGELQRFLDTLTAALEAPADGSPPTLPEEVDLRLVVESDAPCRFTIGPAAGGPAFNVPFHLVREGLASGQAKETLRFPGNEAAVRQTLIQLPRDISVIEASLEVSESFRRDRSEAGEDIDPGSGPSSGTMLDPTLTQRQGVHLEVDRWVGQELSLDGATTVSAIALGLMPLANDTEVTLELQDGWQGRPSGRIISGGKLSLAPAGKSAWATMRLAEPVTLSSQPYWVIARASKGHAVWLADPGEKSALVLARESSPEAWEQRNDVRGVSLLHRLYSRVSERQHQPPVNLDLEGANLPRLVPASGDGAAAPVARPGFDLKDALNTFLPSYAGAENLVSFPVSCRSSIKGFLTVYPPRVVYDLLG